MGNRGVLSIRTKDAACGLRIADNLVKVDILRFVSSGCEQFLV